MSDKFYYRFPWRINIDAERLCCPYTVIITEMRLTWWEETKRTHLILITTLRPIIIVVWELKSKPHVYTRYIVSTLNERERKFRPVSVGTIGCLKTLSAARELAPRYDPLRSSQNWVEKMTRYSPTGNTKQLARMRHWNLKQTSQQVSKLGGRGTIISVSRWIVDSHNGNWSLPWMR